MKMNNLQEQCSSKGEYRNKRFSARVSMFALHCDQTNDDDRNNDDDKERNWIKRKGEKEQQEKNFNNTKGASEDVWEL